MNFPLAEIRPPVPPADLILRVAPSFGAAGIEHVRQAFDEAAIEHLELFDRALSLDGRSFTDFERALDFGCGCGRFLRHLGAIADLVEIHGTDIDVEMINWLSSEHPLRPIRARASRAAAPVRRRTLRLGRQSQRLHAPR